MRNDREPGFGIPLVACLLVATATIVQGHWTDRWSCVDVAAELVLGGERLEQRFPTILGEWEAMNDIEPDPRGLERAGAVGHVSRIYRHRGTGRQVMVFVVCATPHDASGHTPDRCYPGSGFQAEEAESRRSIHLDNGLTADVFTGTFTKAGQTLRIFWTYGGDGHWVAPPIARLGLAGRPLVYKLYAIVDATRHGAANAKATGEKFLAELLPAVDAALKNPAPGASPVTMHRSGVIRS
jgi:hypothetical protein